MNFLTFVTSMSGGSGHGAGRKLFENNSNYRWFDHIKNNKDNKNKFLKLNIAENHFHKKFSDGNVFPHHFDRIENFLNDINGYYKFIESEIYSYSENKKICYICHEIPSNIRKRYPNCFIIQLLPYDSELNKFIKRHMETSMLFPLQNKIHLIPGREKFLNNYYWEQVNYVKNNPDKNCLLDFYQKKFSKTSKEIEKIEFDKQKELYNKQLKNKSEADISLFFYNKNDLYEKLENLNV